MGIFGWSYPPGCSGPPDDEFPCEVCGKMADDCICPECPVCGEKGSYTCYTANSECGLVRTQEQIDSYDEFETYSAEYDVEPYIHRDDFYEEM